MVQNVSSKEIRQLLVRSSFLGGISGSHLDRILKLGVTREKRKGDVILHQDSQDGRLILILSGWVKVFRIASDGREIVLNFLQAGEMLGEIALLDGGARSAGAEMMEAGTIFILQRSDLIPILLANPEALMEVVEVLCQKLRTMSEATEASQLGVDGRFASGLLRLALLHGQNTAQGVEIKLPASQRDIGAYMGISRENASRQIARLVREGAIESSEGRLIIRDIERIRFLAKP